MPCHMDRSLQCVTAWSGLCARVFVDVEPQLYRNSFGLLSLLLLILLSDWHDLRLSSKALIIGFRLSLLLIIVHVLLCLTLACWRAALVLALIIHSRSFRFWVLAIWPSLFKLWACHCSQGLLRHFWSLVIISESGKLGEEGRLRRGQPRWLSFASSSADLRRASLRCRIYLVTDLSG